MPVAEGQDSDRNRADEFTALVASGSNSDLEKERISTYGVSSGCLGEHLGTRLFHLKLIFACIILHVVPASIVGTVPYILTAVAQEYTVSYSTAAWLSSATIFGSVAGAFAFGWLGDVAGRKTTIAACVGVALALTLLQLVCTEDTGFWLLMVLRVLLGLPFGGLSTLTLPYIVEFCSTSTRGMVGTAVNLGWPMGSFYSLVVVCVFGSDQWRSCLLAPCLPCAVVIVCLHFMSESPRWLLVVGRQEEAGQVLDQVFASPDLCGSARPGKVPKLLMAEVPQRDSNSVWHKLSELFAPGLRRITICACLLYTVCAAQGYGFWIWGPEILELATGESAPYWVFMGNEACGAVATVFAMALTDRVGRKPLFLSGCVVALTILLVLATKPSLAVGSFAWLLVGVSQSLMWASTGIYVGEVFPTALRGTGNGLAQLFCRLAGGVWPIVMGTWVSSSLSLTLLAIALPIAAGIVVTVFMMQETARSEALA